MKGQVGHAQRRAESNLTCHRQRLQHNRAAKPADQKLGT